MRSLENRRLSRLAEPGDREAIQEIVESPRKRRLSNMRYISGGDNQQEDGRSKRSRSKRKSAYESTLSPGKKQRLSSRGLDGHCEPSDQKATLGATSSPENRRLSSLAESGGHEATQGTMRSPENRDYPG